MRTTLMSYHVENEYDTWVVKFLENGICVAIRGYDDAEDADYYCHLYEDGEFHV